MLRWARPKDPILTLFAGPSEAQIQHKSGAQPTAQAGQQQQLSTGLPAGPFPLHRPKVPASFFSHDKPIWLSPSCTAAAACCAKGLSCMAISSEDYWHVHSPRSRQGHTQPASHAPRRLRTVGQEPHGSEPEVRLYTCSLGRRSPCSRPAPCLAPSLQRSCFYFGTAFKLPSARYSPCHELATSSQFLLPHAISATS